MTDQESALRLGTYINGLLGEIESLKGVILEYGHQEIPLAEAKKRISQEEIFRRVADAQRTGLLQAIGDETQASALIHALCKHFLAE